FVTGSAIGTSFTPALLLALIGLLPAIIVGAAVSVLIGCVGAVMLMRLGKVGPRTAVLAPTPGGVIEMAHVAARIGADPLPIMVLQTMRVGLTVCVAPFLATLIAESGPPHEVARAEVMPWLTVGALMAASLAGGLILRLFKLPNYWFLGSILTVSVIGSRGPGDGSGPL